MDTVIRVGDTWKISLGWMASQTVVIEAIDGDIATLRQTPAMGNHPYTAQFAETQHMHAVAVRGHGQLFCRSTKSA